MSLKSHGRKLTYESRRKSKSIPVLGKRQVSPFLILTGLYVTEDFCLWHPRNKCRCPCEIHDDYCESMDAETLGVFSGGGLGASEVFGGELKWERMAGSICPCQKHSSDKTKLLNSILLCIYAYYKERKLSLVVFQRRFQSPHFTSCAIQVRLLTLVDEIWGQSLVRRSISVLMEALFSTVLVGQVHSKPKESVPLYRRCFSPMLRVSSKSKLRE